MSQLPLRVLYYGRYEPLPEGTQLRAGPLSMIFEAGDLRYIRFWRPRDSPTNLCRCPRSQLGHDTPATLKRSDRAGGRRILYYLRCGEQGS